MKFNIQPVGNSKNTRWDNFGTVRVLKI